MMSTVLGAVALFALIVLIYGTIDQMRPATLIQSIVATAVAARQTQLPLLAASHPVDGTPSGIAVEAGQSGHVSRIDLSAIQGLLDRHGDLRITIRPAIGDFVTNGDPLAILSRSDDAIAKAVRGAILLTQKRDIADDAGYSLHHLHTIGWTAISTARSDPAVGSIAIQALRDLAVAWREHPPRAVTADRLAYDDRLPLQLIDTIESLMVASAESKQHQSMALLLDTLTAILPTMPVQQQRALADIMRTAATLAASHTPTRVLVQAMRNAASACQRHGLREASAMLAEAGCALQDRAG